MDQDTHALVAPLCRIQDTALDAETAGTAFTPLASWTQKEMGRMASPLFGYPQDMSGMKSPAAYDGANKENDREPGLMITAPVPLLYAARSKAGLQSILSAGEEHGAETDIAWGEPVDSAYIDPATHNATRAMTMQSMAAQKLASSVHTKAGLDVGFPLEQDRPPASHITYGGRMDRPPPTIVRPISASTLIALTEPCLMAWCLDPASDLNMSNVEQRSNDWLPSWAIRSGDVDGHTIVSQVPHPPVCVNSWGY